MTINFDNQKKKEDDNFTEWIILLTLKLFFIILGIVVFIIHLIGG